MINGGPDAIVWDTYARLVLYGFGILAGCAALYYLHRKAERSDQVLIDHAREVKADSKTQTAAFLVTISKCHDEIARLHGITEDQNRFVKEMFSDFKEMNATRDRHDAVTRAEVTKIARAVEGRK